MLVPMPLDEKNAGEVTDLQELRNRKKKKGARGGTSSRLRMNLFGGGCRRGRQSFQFFISEEKGRCSVTNLLLA